jgi:hypothetical protein
MFTSLLVTLLWVIGGLAIYCYLAIWAFVLFILASIVSFCAFALVQHSTLSQEPLE